MANKCMNRWSTSLAIREMQIVTSVIFHLSDRQKLRRTLNPLLTRIYGNDAQKLLLGACIFTEFRERFLALSIIKYTYILT